MDSGVEYKALAFSFAFALLVIGAAMLLTSYGKNIESTPVQPVAAQDKPLDEERIIATFNAVWNVQAQLLGRVVALEDKLGIERKQAQDVSKDLPAPSQP